MEWSGRWGVHAEDTQGGRGLFPPGPPGPLGHRPCHSACLGAGGPTVRTRSASQPGLATGTVSESTDPQTTPLKPDSQAQGSLCPRHTGPGGSGPEVSILWLSHSRGAGLGDPKRSVSS